MSFWKNLFGGGASAEDGAPRVLGEEDFEGYRLRALEMKAGGEYQLCGEIEKEIDGVVKTHRFIRADRMTSTDVATTATLAKAKQIIGEVGDKMFA